MAFGGIPRKQELKRFSEKDIRKLAAKIASYANKRSLKGVNAVLLSIKGVGNFFAWQILCDLLEARILGLNCDNQWISLGPGAKYGLWRLFTEDKLHTSRGELKSLCSKWTSIWICSAGNEFPSFYWKISLFEECGTCSV